MISGRTFIWDRVLVFVKEHPIIGNGYYRDSYFEKVINMPGLTTAHNYFLQLVFWGGIVAIVLFCCYFFVLDIHNSSLHGTNLYTCLILILFVYMLREEVESAHGEMIILIFFMSFFQKNFMTKEMQYNG